MKFDVEKSVVLVSFLTSFFAVFLAAGIVIGVSLQGNCQVSLVLKSP